MVHREGPASDITRLLGSARAGDAEALNELFPLVYDQLRELARGQRRRWHGDLTLNATALVHEAYAKLMDQGAVPSESREHFFAVAARVMRHVLCNYARDRGRLKRGGSAPHVTIDDSLHAPDVIGPEADDLIALDGALVRLEAVSERQARVVECRFFAGLSIDETASALGVSPATVKRDWTLAKAWLYRAVREGRDGLSPSSPSSVSSRGTVVD